MNIEDVYKRQAQAGYIFPPRLYQGIKIYFDIEQLSQHAQERMSAFELDFTLLRENYCRRQKRTTLNNNFNFC